MKKPSRRSTRSRRRAAKRHGAVTVVVQPPSTPAPPERPFDRWLRIISAITALALYVWRQFARRD